MSRYRTELPQLSGDLFLADAGIETDLIFNHGIEIREFAAHTLLSETAGREALANYFRPFLRLAKQYDAGFILDSQTWKAHRHWASDLQSAPEELRQANRDSIQFISELRDEFPDNKPIVLTGIVGPRGDAYSPDQLIEANQAREYYREQVGWLSETECDMVCGTTFTQAGEAIGLVLACNELEMPVVISFTVETDGSLPTGQSLGEAIVSVDDATNCGASYFAVNCAHPDHFFHVLKDQPWGKRIKAMRCNASRQSHAELDACEVLDDGNPTELGSQYREVAQRMPWINIFGGCCGTDLRHVTQIAESVSDQFPA